MASFQSFKNFFKLSIFGLRTIKARMIVSFSILIAISISIFGFIDFYNYSNTFLKENINYTSTIASQVTINLDTYLKEAETSLKLLSMNDLVISSIKNYNNNSTYDNLKNSYSLKKLVNDIMSQKPDISNIVIYANGMVLNSNRNLGDVYNMPFLKSVEEAYKNRTTADILFFKNYVVNDFNDSDLGSRLSISTPIRDLEHFGKNNFGYVVFDMNMRKMDEMFTNSKLSKNNISLISNGSGKVIYSNKSGFFNSNFNWNQLSDVYKNSSGTLVQKIGKGKMLVTYSTSTINGWKVVFVIDMSELDRSLNNTKFFSIFLILISIIITILISLIISVKSTTPLARLVKQMHLIGQGNLDIRIKETNGVLDEINTLNKGFNSMMDRISQLIKEVYQTKLKRREAEFEALQAKINPHFLYNTLQTINSLAVLERTKEVEQVATSLGNLLEYLVYEQNEEVRVYQEIDYIKSYLEIQNTRYNNSFEVQIDIDQDVYSCFILKLLLQPIVENSILHGLDKKREKGILRITGRLENNNAVFEIVDNGEGMDIETLKHINDNLENADSSNIKKSIGLMNVQERIKLKFGEEYGIKIHSTQFEGTSVIVTIPSITEKGGVQ